MASFELSDGGMASNGGARADGVFAHTGHVDIITAPVTGAARRSYPLGPLRVPM